MPRVRVLPYKAASKSAKLLAEGLGGKRLKPGPDSTFVAQPGDVVINWGNVSLATRCTLNCDPEVLKTSSNKLLFFQHFAGSGITPNFWTDREDIPDEAFPIVCRTVLNGHSGAGIVLASVRSELVDAPLYVQYVAKIQEYRVHVGQNGTIIAVQQKKRKLNHENPNWKIRNHSNGFIYAREGVDPPAGVVGAAQECVAALHLDFGAVDVGWHPSKGAVVYEVNTAPGLEGRTLDDYVNYFKGFM